MRIERTLLKEVLYVIGEYTEDAQERTEILIAEIEKLLAQPEQSNEPVAWMQDSIELYVLEEKSAIRGYVIPLYTAPPKRERINHDDILDRSINGSFEYRDGFMDGVMFAENHHGIGGGE